MWFIGVEVEQKTSAPPPKKILDPPPSYRHRTNKLTDRIKQNQLRENDWTTENLTNNKRLFSCDIRRIETHQWHYKSS